MVQENKSHNVKSLDSRGILSIEDCVPGRIISETLALQSTSVNNKLDCLDNKIEKYGVLFEKISNAVNDMRVEMAKTLELHNRINQVETNIAATAQNVFNLSIKTTELAESIKRLDKIEESFIIHQSKDTDTIHELESVISTMKEKQALLGTQEKTSDNMITSIERMEIRLAKMEKYIYWGLGAIGTIGSFTVIKLLYDVITTISNHT